MNLSHLFKSYLSRDDKMKFIRLWERLRGSLYNNNLTQLSKIFKTDKYGIHFYTPHYQTHLSNRRNRRLKILEIGVGGYDDPESGGHSLRMWKAYFSKAEIYGLDIYDKSLLEESRIKIFQGSQTDFNFLKKVLKDTGELDVIIDDGSHLNSDVIDTFRFLFPLMAQGGIYFIEDVQTSYWKDKGGDSIDLDNQETIMGFFKGLIDGLNHKEFERPGYKPKFFDLNITSIHFYHNLIVIYKGLNNEPSNHIVDNQHPKKTLY